MLVLLFKFSCPSCSVYFDFILFLDLSISIYNLSSYASVIVSLSWIETF